MISLRSKRLTGCSLAAALLLTLANPALAQDTAPEPDAEAELQLAIEAEIAAETETRDQGGEPATESMVIPEAAEESAPTGNVAPGPAGVQQLTLGPANPALDNLNPTRVKSLDNDLWTNMPPAMAVELMGRITPGTLPPVLRDLLHRMLLSDATLGTAMGAQFYEKRILLLLELGDWNSVNVFVSRAFANQPNPALAEMLLALQLINNGLPAACKSRADIAASVPESTAWATNDLQYLAIACQLQNGQRAEADLALSLRSESGNADPAFERLYLAMADNAALEDMSDRANKAGYFRRVLYLAMARAAGSDPAKLGASPDRLSDLPALLLSAGTSPDMRVLAAEEAFAAGRLKRSDLEAVYTASSQNGGASLSPLTREALAKHRTMKAFGNEMEIPNIKGYIHALAEALATARARGQTEMAAKLYATTILNLRADQADKIDTGIVARTLAETGDFETARDWFMEAYFFAQNGDANAFKGMTLSWPLMAMAPDGPAPRGVENLADGLMEILSPQIHESDRRKAALLFTLMEEFDRPPHAPLWDRLLPPADVSTAMPAIDQTLWRGMVAAADEDETARTLLLMMAALSTAPIEQHHPAFIAACVQALISLDLEIEGRKLALEALVAAGF